MPEENKAKNIIILSGPVGAGKTTVARELIRSATIPTVYIEGDTFWGHIQHDTGSLGRHKNFRIIMRAMVASAIAYAASGYEVILDFSIPPDFLDVIRKLRGARDITINYVVLRPDETICAERAAARPEGIVNDYAQYHELYKSFDEVKNQIANNDMNNSSSIALQIKDSIAKGSFTI